ncbi:hypothetical protein B0H14DRAFT_2620033 [Mycena olivaceomarginata]|nr:hypothetical protein B0H14DRAFT_2620033 [Mycena olivaceomarginata]
MSSEHQEIPRPSFLRAVCASANLLEEGGYLNSQTPDTQIFGFLESQSTGGTPELSADIANSDESYKEDGPFSMGTNQLEYPELLLRNEEHTEEDQMFVTEADRIMLEETGHSPRGTEFPILKHWGGDGEYLQALEPLL